MYAGNKRYDKLADLPQVIPVFPLPGALLLPRGELPLRIFEPRYLSMVDWALAGDRLIGMIQPVFSTTPEELSGKPELCKVGCVGRITALVESGYGRYHLTLTGVARFKLVEEIDRRSAYRQARVCFTEYAEDLGEADEEMVDRATLLTTLKAYLEANNLETDWDSIRKASTEILVNALSMMSPYGPAEKQALLEAPDLKSRAETLIAITEMELARRGDPGSTLQ
ncbi:LON peptidase substrate-binding domain-containing protein [Breoghania sp.]|uniref:LON peptidase substrate-binding domain-containing protein n=1 Tax=Breoghania sp. TaxID=2065378 RepID=UPI0026032953|nr:LON peptidase substrate-binding domain-containing protein [Breoghania sp.]MDJ0930515.1 LON peptidase substrate-binding domain-containing protein [Breoghania sp.]